MVEFYSDYYEKDISINDQQQQILFNIYVNVANSEGFIPEIESHDQINNTEIYDHVAYHVETFGHNFDGYEEIENLF